jgi:hypothetical protein
VATVTSNTPVTGVPSLVSGIATRAEAAGDGLAATLGLAEALTDGLGDGLGLLVGLGLGEGLTLATALAEGDGEVDGDGLVEAVTVAGV